MSPVRCCALAGLVLAALASSARSQEAAPVKAPGSELLPKPPAAMPKPWRPVRSIDDVPEVCLEERPDLTSQALPKDAGGRADAHLEKTLNDIRKLERDNPAGFVVAIKKHRPDLAGLPFCVGKDAAMNPALCKHFTDASTSLSAVINGQFGGFSGAFGGGSNGFSGGGALGGGGFQGWPGVSSNGYSTMATYRPGLPAPAAAPAGGAGAPAPDATKWKFVAKTEPELLAYALLAKQKLYPRSAEGRMALVQILQATPSREVNGYLAQLAMFAPEGEVREAAIQSLKVRRNERYQEVFLEGLSYPMATVANNAADAIVKLELTELLPKIAEKLAQLDPQAPMPDETGSSVRVREVVKINHARNCMLCHSPADVKWKGRDNFAAGVPNPRLPLTEGAPYYAPEEFAKAIRFDVTYLRPDFSLTLPVAKEDKSEEWPALQRFDFIVRQRTLTEAEVDAYDKAKPLLPPSPNREAALRVLRELSGVDAGTTAEAWMELLNKKDDSPMG